MSKTDKTPSPGSGEAAAAGCFCPVADNRYGEGIATDVGTRFWFINEGCPVHDASPRAQLIELGADAFADLYGSAMKELEDR